MFTTVIITVLIAIAVAAVITVPLMIRSTRRQVGESGRSRRPSLGSPAQVWVERGERVLRELELTAADHAALYGVVTDAGQVVAELRLTASQVAELDDALARIPVPRLKEDQERLAGALAEAAARPADEPGAAEQARTHAAITARLAAADRQRAARDALLAKMEAAVAGLERARDELAELIAGAAVPLPAEPPPTTALTSRLAGLREGLVEVRRLSYPEIKPGPGSEGQGHP